MSAFSTATLDPITVEVTRHRLEGIANEMQSTLLRSSFSPIVKEGLDASAGLFTADGQTLAQACSIPIHLATLIPAVARIIRDFPPATMQPDDTYLLNDPYCGGTHLPDIARGAADLRQWAHHRLRRGDDASPGHGRALGRVGADQCDGDLPGGAAHPATEVPRPRRGERDAWRR